MRRGTTPTHIFKTDLDLTGADAVYVTYQQYGKTVLEKDLSDMTVEEESLTVRLTQTETLLFREKPDGTVRIQIRARWPDGDALASNIIETTVKEILKEGEI